jgi:hypothetical protein
MRQILPRSPIINLWADRSRKRLEFEGGSGGTAQPELQYVPYVNLTFQQLQPYSTTKERYLLHFLFPLRHPSWERNKTDITRAVTYVPPFLSPQA